jgi:hypothetical protein
MISIILLSACVSLITIGVLFIQRIRPRKIQIPSYFLAHRNQSKVNNIKRTPPQWWEIVLILCSTLGTAAAFYAQDLPHKTQDARGEALVWFDPTLSHIAALNSSVAAREAAIDSLKDLRLREYIFINLSFNFGENGKVQPEYTFEKVNSDALNTYVNTLLNKPSALSQPLEPSLLSQEVKLKLDRDSNQFTLILATDGQAETLRNTAPLKDIFQSVSVIRTPSTERVVSGEKIEIVPEELAKVWSRESGEQESFLPASPQFTKLDGQMKRQIPPQARPSISLETFGLAGEEQSEARAEPLTIFSSEYTENGSNNRPTQPQPLLTTCTLGIAGPGELDGMSDIRAYAQYFTIPIRPLACRHTESSTSAMSSETFDPWKYRKASLWIVPVNEFVASDLFQKRSYWIPEGFAPHTDVLVYIADTRLQGFNDFLEQALVQLEKNQAALSLPLLPLPPKKISFPWQRSHINASEHLEEQSQNKRAGGNDDGIALRAADGTPLAFTLSQKPTVVYLRTGGAAPNGELGRWGQWAQLWNSLKTNIEHNSPLVTRVQITNPMLWAQWNDRLSANKTPPLRYRVDPATLRGALMTEKSRIIFPEPGLYVRERDDHLLLLEPPVTERQGGLLTQAEIEQMFPTRAQGPSTASDGSTQATTLQLAGAGLALISLLALWILQRSGRLKATLATSVGALCLFYVGLRPSTGCAQSDRPPPFDSRLLLSPERRNESTNHPFRIGWCDAVIPDPVSKRYSALQKLLANRGTIELPQQLKAGACQVGASDIWWTSSLDALQAAPVAQHVRSGGVIIAEGITLKEIPEWMVASADSSIGLVWETPKRRGMLYRSFYLLSSFDGCTPEKTLMLTLRKKINAQAPMALVTPARFLTHDSEGTDCFITDDDYRTRSFVNMMYALLTTDYKEDQMQLPEILNRVRNLGLEP